MRHKIRLLVVVFAVIFALLAASGVAVAGDMPVIVQTQPSEVDAEPGETVEIEIYVTSDGGYGDVKVESVEVAMNLPDGVSAVDAEPGTWFETDARGDTEPYFVFDTDGSEVVVEHGREDGGATGMNELFATVVFEVDDDATGEHTIGVDAHPRMTNGNLWPAVSHNATVTVAERGAAADEPEGETTSDEDDDSGDTDEVSDTNNGDDADEDAESLPGFGFVAFALAALLSVTCIQRLRNDA